MRTSQLIGVSCGVGLEPRRGLDYAANAPLDSSRFPRRERTIGDGLMRHVLAAVVGAALAASPGVAQGEPAPQAYRIETLAEGLKAPWGMAFLPDGGILVTEKASAQLRLVRNGALVAEPVAGAPDDVFGGGQGGLLDVAVHPDFATNGLVYLSYSWGDGEANGVRLARARLEGGALVGLEPIFTASPLKTTNLHYGGRIAFLPDETLLMTVGDGFQDREQAQMLTSLLGKIVRLRDDGAIPTDNPYAGEPVAKGEIWTIGHRNEQGLAVDPATGAVWETEHGPWGGDELNLIERGGNYGWPVITWGRDYNGAAISPFREYPGMEQPKVDWTPVIAASGLAVYRGSLFPAWDGDILAGGLQAQAVVRVEVAADGTAQEVERLFGEVGARIRDVRVGPDGAIYLLTDDYENGWLVRISPM
jgi:glucose/arabinose dehydrogenase